LANYVRIIGRRCAVAAKCATVLGEGVQVVKGTIVDICDYDVGGRFGKIELMTIPNV
jgi:hypothetical protein